MSAIRKWLLPSLVCLPAALVCVPGFARECGSAPVPYKAVYSVNRAGDPDGSMTVKLVRKAPDSYRYNMETRLKWGIFTAYIDEQSDFTFRDGVVLPVSFELSKRVSLYKRREVVEFDWLNMKAAGEKKSDDFELEIAPGMQDKLTVYLLLAESLCRGEYDIDADVVSGPELKSYDYRFQAAESIDTVLGRLEAIHIRRGGPDDEKQTDLWHAVQTDFLPVKMVYRDGNVITDMRLLEFDFEKE